MQRDFFPQRGVLAWSQRTWIAGLMDELMPSVYNDSGDIESLVAALATIGKAQRERTSVDSFHGPGKGGIRYQPPDADRIIQFGRVPTDTAE